MIEAYTLLKEAFSKAFREAGVDLIAPIGLERPKVASHGDYSCSIAMQYAKSVGKNPRELASSVMDKLVFPDGYVAKTELAGPGFINVTLGPQFYVDSLVELVGTKESLGRLDVGKGAKVNVEYVSANPTGLLHLGHGRNAAIGDTVANILDWCGYNVTREFYFNNAGNQMNKLGLSAHLRYLEALGHPINFPEDGYHGDYVKEIARQVTEKYGESLVEPLPDNIAVCRKEAEEWCFRAIKETLLSMDIRHDIFYNEDTLYSDGLVDEVIEQLKDRGLAYEKEGALWGAFSTLDPELQDRVIVKSSGEPTYRLPDIAYHATKFKRGFDLIVDVFGADHIATIPDVMAGVRALGYDYSKIKVLIYQFVTLMEGETKVKMSKRSGKSYTLDVLIDELGADVVRFFFIMRGIATHLEFDLELASEQSEKNPVFYLQYAHARTCSVIEAAKGRGLSITADTDLQQLNHASEYDLIRHLIRFPETVEKAGKNLEPQMVAEYLRELAAAFHKFYHDCSILRAERPDLIDARLALVDIVRCAMRNGLTILGISAPERM